MLRCAFVVLWVAMIQPAASPMAAQTDPDDDLVISLLTFGPGFRPWEHFGHNALWVQQPSRRIDVLYNYGFFDLDESDFVPRFIRGRMEYRVAPESPRAIELRYLVEHRSVWVQELNLTTRQRVDLREFLAHNVQPGNERYRYHYYYDNCSTRIRDALDAVLGGRLKAQTDTIPSGSSFRFQTQRLTADDVLLYTGLLIGLANPVDREMTVWEEMFLPIAMRERVRDVTTINDAGDAVPLVASERTINEDPRYDGLVRPPAWMLWYLLAGCVVAVPLMLLGREPGGRAREVAFGALATLWTAVIGIGGGILAFLWFLSDHTTSYWNENLFFFNPVALALALLIAPLVVGVRWPRPAAALCARIVMVSGLLGVVVQLLPGVDQVNGQIIALVLPSNLALCSGVLRRAIPDIQIGAHDPDVSTA